MSSMWVFMLVCVVFCSGAFPPGDRYARETSESKLARNLVNAIAKLTADVTKGMTVTKLKEKCDRINEGIEELSQQITQLQSKAYLGETRSMESDDVIIGIGKLKKEATNIGVTTSDVLALTVGNGNMDADFRRLRLSVKLLDRMRKNELKPDLDALVNAKDGPSASEALENVQGSLRAISKIVDGMKSTATDAEITNQMKGNAEYGAAKADKGNDSVRTLRTSKRAWFSAGGSFGVSIGRK